MEVTDENTQSDASPATEASNASLGRATRQRKIDNLKGKLKDVKAKTIKLKELDFKQVNQLLFSQLIDMKIT